MLGTDSRVIWPPRLGTKEGAILTVHDLGSGDDTIVEQVRTRGRDADAIVVVTADRVLRERVAAAGGSSVGPSWLLARTT